MFGRIFRSVVRGIRRVINFVTRPFRRTKKEAPAVPVPGKGRPTPRQHKHRPARPTAPDQLITKWMGRDEENVRHYTRITSTNVAFQTHVAKDSEFALLPVMEKTTIKGWRVYHTPSGTFADERVFDSVPEATQWIEQYAHTLEEEACQS